MKTQGEIEASICQGMSRYEQEYMGRGPKDIRTHLIDDLVVVRLQGVLTAAEQHLFKSLPAEMGRDLLKQVRTHLPETARPLMEAMVRDITGVKVLSLHHDISTLTGEEVVIFTLAEPPQVRELKKKSNSWVVEHCPIPRSDLQMWAMVEEPFAGRWTELRAGSAIPHRLGQIGVRGPEYHVGQLPVIDGSELVGVVSIRDLVKSLNEQVEAENRLLTDYLHGRSWDAPRIFQSNVDYGNDLCFLFTHLR
jgi:uncharacterized protein YbcI